MKLKNSSSQDETPASETGETKARPLIQWHPAFCAALRIELAQDMEILDIREEYLLSNKPMQIDTVVMKKQKDYKIQKNIGHIFRAHNIIQYKSPEDYLSIRDFYKTYGYACFYQSETEKTGEISPQDITITFVCNHYPFKLLKHLKEFRGITVRKYDEGIYYLEGDEFEIQLIITHQLSNKQNYWLQNLRTNLKSGGEIKDLVAHYEPHQTSTLYQAVMNVILRANWEKAQEEKNMCEALYELFAKELKESKAEGEQKVNRLNQLLLGQSRLTDLERSIKEPAYQQKLFQEFEL